MRDFAEDPPGPLTLVLRAVFVPDGRDPPLEFMADPNPLRVRATYDPGTGILTCEDSSGGVFAGMPGHWYPATAEDDDPFAEDDGCDNANDEIPAWARGLALETPDSE